MVVMEGLVVVVMVGGTEGEGEGEGIPGEVCGLTLL
jgi:hypothetical protein